MQAQDDAVVPEATVQKEQEDIILSGGARMPLLGLGTFKLKDVEAVKTAIQLGYRHIDCASIYHNQELVGEGLRDYLSSSPDARSNLWITSKVWNDAHRPELVFESVEKTLQDLQCEYLDLLLIHWPDAWLPGTNQPDNTVTIKETYQAMEQIVDQGKVKFLGVSNFGLSQIEDILSWCRVKPICNQIELHPMLPQRKLVGVSRRKGVHSVAYSPLGQGSNELVDHPIVKEVAQETGKTCAQVLLKWNVQRGVPVIPKATSPSHLSENFQGMFEWKLTWDQKSKLDSLEKPGKRFIVTDFHTWEDVEEGGAKKPSVVFEYAP